MLSTVDDSLRDVPGSKERIVGALEGVPVDMESPSFARAGIETTGGARVSLATVPNTRPHRTYYQGKNSDNALVAGFAPEMTWMDAAGIFRAGGGEGERLRRESDFEGKPGEGSSGCTGIHVSYNPNFKGKVEADWVSDSVGYLILDNRYCVPIHSNKRVESIDDGFAGYAEFSIAGELARHGLNAATAPVVLLAATDGFVPFITDGWTKAGVEGKRASYRLAKHVTQRLQDAAQQDNPALYLAQEAAAAFQRLAAKEHDTKDFHHDDTTVAYLPLGTEATRPTGRLTAFLTDGFGPRGEEFSRKVMEVGHRTARALAERFPPVVIPETQMLGADEVTEKTMPQPPGTVPKRP